MTQKPSCGLVEKSFECSDIPSTRDMHRNVIPLLGQQRRLCASQASYLKVNEENNGLYSFYK